ncbi:BID domain-containing T4SS effector [Bartonella sp. Raccoon60]|uniref:BID domain-containing T4SS effector n=1 Tax=Bartonella sp. Raccoon60 TaxID=1933912 RepID=UPI0009C1B42E|nr:BID domain-containing T4SS effector [Bartonella sp. Raccoon60]AQX26278.1 Bartonella effector protein Bep9 [Bartonella sp. Raccoon60]
MPNYVLVPSKEVPSLTDDEIIKRALRDPLIEDIQKEITSLSLIVSKNWQALPSLIQRINDNPNSASELANIFRDSPESFLELAGFKIFGFKSSRRIRAEQHVLQLSLAIHKYGDTIKNVKDAIIYRNNLEQARCIRKILMPNDNVQSLIALSHDELCNVFKNQDTFQLGKEVWLFLNSVEMRLSENELQMLEENQSQPLAESIGISDDQALKLIDVVTKAKKVLEEINLFQKITYSLNEAQTQKLGSKQKGIYANYNPREAQTQRLRSEGEYSDVYDTTHIYENPDAQTQNLRSEEEDIYEDYNPYEAQTQKLGSKQKGIYANYNPREAQTQRLRSEGEYSDVYDTTHIYDNPDAQTQRLRSEGEYSDVYGTTHIYDNPDAQTQRLRSEGEYSDVYGTTHVYDNPDAQTQNLRSEEENIYENYNSSEVQTQNSKRFLIPVKALAPLTQNEVINKIKIDSVVQEYAEKVQNLSELVFGNRELLNNYLTQIIKNPQLGETYSQKLENSPESFFRLAGFKILGIKSLQRIKAENNVPELCKATKKYAEIVEMCQKQILKNYEKEQERIRKSVVMPSNEIQHLLNLPSDVRKNILREKNTSQINKELSVFLNQVNSRLSIHERIAIKENDCQALASSIKVSEVQAQKIINLVKEAKTFQQEIKDIISPQKERSLAVAI